MVVRGLEKHITVGVMSRIGRRGRNEDSVGCDRVGNRAIWALADGAGGHEEGDRASRMAVEAAVGVLSAAAPSDGLRSIAERGMQAAQAAVLGERDSRPGLEIASTLTLLVSDGRAVAWGHAGDSRLYLRRRGRVRRLTQDHGLPIRPAMGSASPVQLVSALGVRDAALDSGKAFRLAGGDVFLICSDGVWTTLPHAAIWRACDAAPDLGAWLNAIKAMIEASADPDQDNYSAVALCVGAWGRAARPSWLARLWEG